MTVAPLRLREAVPADAPTMARTMALGFQTYRAFAPAGWEPPSDFTDWIRRRLAAPGAWALLAEHAGEPAGHVALYAERGDEARTAYLWQLFVRPSCWGGGLAGRCTTPSSTAPARTASAGRGWSPRPRTRAAGASTAARLAGRGTPVSTPSSDGARHPASPAVGARRSAGSTSSP